MRVTIITFLNFLKIKNPQIKNVFNNKIIGFISLLAFVIFGFVIHISLNILSYPLFLKYVHYASLALSIGSSSSVVSFT